MRSDRTAEKGKSSVYYIMSLDKQLFSIWGRMDGKAPPLYHGVDGFFACRVVGRAKRRHELLQHAISASGVPGLNQRLK